jgi:hypothetical protein
MHVWNGSNWHLVDVSLLADVRFVLIVRIRQQLLWNTDVRLTLARATADQSDINHHPRQACSRQRTFHNCSLRGLTGIISPPLIHR